ncbi:MAG: hypothetical protein BGP06_05815 [Rhizobiales bacterium 65-9]|nr:hypothetical protein [Hyphomicrobiales bacterium]OJY35383.1 MAG: hypothetical protein BGP06_05815 [Rhizobiales bacterium 65-9]
MSAGAGGLWASYGWTGALALVWLVLLAGTVAFLGYRLVQSRRRDAEGKAAAESARAVQMLERSSQRMPLLEFVKRAGRSGWDVSGRSIEIMDLLQGLRKACAAGMVRTWGRPISPNPELMRTELHRPIPDNHWRSFEFDVDTIVGRADNFETKSCNLRQSDRHNGGYIDIYVDQQAALDWLDAGATEFRRGART